MLSSAASVSKSGTSPGNLAQPAADARTVKLLPFLYFVTMFSGAVRRNSLTVRSFCTTGSSR